MNQRLRLAHILARAMILRMRLENAIGPRAVKSIQGYANDYQVALSELVADVFNGERTGAQLESGHRALIKEYPRPTYIEGMTEGGMEDAEAEMDDEDEARVKDWINEQLQHVAGFAEAAVAARDADDTKSAQDAVNHRVELWAQALRDLGSAGYLRAKEGEMAYFQLGATEKHCSSCLGNSRLKPMRVSKWLSGDYLLPQSPDLECGGFNCDCKLRSVRTDKVLYPR